MGRKYLAFDIEIAKLLPDGARDWFAHRPLGITCAATLASDSDELRLWYGLTGDGQPANRMSRPEVTELIRFLEKKAAEGYSILTWNGLSFDFRVLADETGEIETCVRLALNHTDMMLHVFCQLGFPVGLDRAAKGMGLPGKPPGMDGALAPRYWAEGKRQEVLDYVARDVHTTLDLARRGGEKGYLRWITRSGRPKTMPLPRGWLSVQEALALPEPDTSWMSNPWPRSKFTAWTEGQTVNG